MPFVRNRRGYRSPMARHARNPVSHNGRAGAGCVFVEILDVIPNATEQHVGPERTPAWVATAREFICEDFALMECDRRRRRGRGDKTCVDPTRQMAGRATTFRSSRPPVP